MPGNCPVARHNYKTTLGVLLLMSLGIALAVLKASRDERLVWPEESPQLQDLPPPDRTAWPETPHPWREEYRQVEVVSPAGVQRRGIRYYFNSIGMGFVRIEPGVYDTRGSGPSGQPETSRRGSPDLRRRVRLSRPYYLGACEVTNAQYEQFVPARKALRPDYQQQEDAASHPVEPVTWRAAQGFARWLSAREGRLYRLPTEAEWEYAARAGTRQRFYWGEDFRDRSMANLGGMRSLTRLSGGDGYRHSAPVGQYPANPWGLFDMIGNAGEWVADWYGALPAGEYTDPPGAHSGDMRVGKGGGWSTRPSAMFIGQREGDAPEDRRDRRGFRLLVEIVD